MKTTVELPDALVNRVKIRALQQGRKFEDALTDLLVKGLGSPEKPGRKTSQRIKTDPETGIPLIQCDPNAPASRMTAEELVALEKATLTGEDLDRLGISL